MAPSYKIRTVAEKAVFYFLAIEFNYIELHVSIMELSVLITCVNSKCSDRNLSMPLEWKNVYFLFLYKIDYQNLNLLWLQGVVALEMG